jgi:integrase
MNREAQGMLSPGYAPCTVRQVLAWARQHVRAGNAEAQKERERIWDRFGARYGDHKTGDCRAYHLLEFIDSHESLRSDWTRKRWASTIQRPFNLAEELGLIDKNPFRRLRMPQGQDGRDWTDAEYETLLRAAKPYFRRFLVFLRFSGARPGEARLLAPGNVDMAGEQIVLRRHKTVRKTRRPRVIPFNSTLVKLLVLLMREVRKRKGDRLFLNSYGRPWTTKALTKHFRALTRRHGLSDEVKLHGGRHTFATHAICHKVDIAELAELLGHSSIQSTQRYVHLATKRQHLRDAMERAIGRGKK